MFHAGLVLPSSSLLLQLLTGPFEDLNPSALLEFVDPPVRAGLIGRADGRAPEFRFEDTYGDAAPFLAGAPVLTGLSAPALFGPIVVGNLAGFVALATRLNALRHWSTCAGSLDSNRSTVRNLSWAGMFKGGDSHARRKCDMFSIWMNGICDCLNLMPGEGRARLASLGKQKVSRATKS